MTPALLDALQGLLGDRLATAEALREQHGAGESFHPPDPPDAVVFPRSTEEVSAIVRSCAEHDTPIIPFGAGTSLEGHVNATRATGRAKCERWQLNRMPGRTDACLLFVNAIFGPILGLKPFPSWRALARALGAFARRPGPLTIHPPLASTARRRVDATLFRCARR